MKDAVIVLGALVHPDGRLSTTLERRLETALKEDRRQRCAAFILCGGIVGREPGSEASCMRDFLVKRGVEPGRIRMDENSRNTGENLCNAREIMRAEGLASARLVTSDYHMRRALYLARKCDMRVKPVPSPDPEQVSHRYKARARECLSWIRLLLCGNPEKASAGNCLRRRTKSFKEPGHD